MKLYILFWNNVYDGHDEIHFSVMGIYSSEKLAKEAQEKIMLSVGYAGENDFWIDERELDKTYNAWEI